MKNKRYKRLAKRIKGTCIHLKNNKDFKSCRYCPLFTECVDVVYNTNRIPFYLQIRTIERVCKYGR